ncbi:MAG: nitrilase-related carbon-nitrogen hydrolase [Leptospirales bacterium]|jgi:apolipoprotein N-acyltransferase
MSALKRGVLCLGAGLGVLGALAPFESRIAGVIAAACLIQLSRGLARSGFRAALGWSLLATLAVATVAFHWVVAGLMNIAGLSAWSAIPVFVFQGLAFHFQIAFVVLGGRWLIRKSALAWIWIFPALGAAADLWLYQLFPWRFGDLAGGGVYVRQFASVAGVYGLSAIVFLEAGIALYLLRFVRRRIRGHASRAGLRRATARLTVPVLILAGVYLYGVYRVTTPEVGLKKTRGAAEYARVGFLQPNTGPGYNADRDDQAFAGRALNLVFNYGLKTLLQDRGRLDLLILPESAVPFFGTDSRPGNDGIYSTTYHAVVAFLARYGDVDVLYNELAGVAMEVDAAPGGATGYYYNLATVFSRRTGARVASYQKRRLVPFGEYLPGETRWPWLREIFQETSRYIAGASPHETEVSQGEAGMSPPDHGAGGLLHFYSGALPYSIRGGDDVTALPRLTQADLDVLTDARLVTADWPARGARATGYLQPLICYEGLFPDHVREMIRASSPSPDFLVNMVNDSWFGDVLENHHHESGARLRAVESGRYLIRPTLTGVSSVFDSRGREVIAPIAVGVQDIRVVAVPRMPNAWTPYLEYGDRPIIGCILLILAFAFWRRRP